MGTEVESILKLMHLAEKLKTELRHSWLSSGRRESVVEQTWQMALLAFLVHHHLAKPVNLEHTLKMILIHDLAEAETGDIPFFEIIMLTLRYGGILSMSWFSQKWKNDADMIHF